ncbi:MAG: hypothetical protein QM784_14325 [Polyangiaceae bacterium]
MKLPSSRRFVLWGVLLLGALALGKQLEGIRPLDNRLILRLPPGEVRSVRVELSDASGELLRSVTLFPKDKVQRSLEYTVRLPKGTYRADLAFERRSDAFDDKNHGGGLDARGRSAPDTAGG